MSSDITTLLQQWRAGEAEARDSLFDTVYETLHEMAMARLRTVQPGGTVTAGNAAQQNDAAAACLVVAEDRLAELKGLGVRSAKVGPRSKDALFKLEARGPATAKAALADAVRRLLPDAESSACK